MSSVLSTGQFGHHQHRSPLELGDDYSIGSANQLGARNPVHQADADVAPLMSSTFGTVASTTMWRQRRGLGSRVLAYTGANAGSVFKFPGSG